MDLTSAAIEQYVQPSGAYKDLPALFNGTGAWDGSRVQRLVDAEQSASPWQFSPMNPASRVNTLDYPEQPHWRVDASFKAGRRIIVTPAMGSRRFPPLRIDVQLPDPADIPGALRTALGLNASTHIRGGHRLDELGISRYLVRALQEWSSTFTDFYSYYTTIPFSSLILFENIGPSFSPDIKIEKPEPDGSFLTLEEFCRQYCPKGTPIPERRSLYELDLVHQINEAVSIVHIRGGQDSTPLIFKCAVAKPELFYHELKMLLTLRTHQHVCSRPLYVVTAEGFSTAGPVVVGFILYFYSGGSLEMVLPSRLQDVCPTFQEKLKWSIQLTEVLRYLTSTEETFFCDLKVENIVLSCPIVGQRDIVLVDFEQIGADCSWSPPEIVALERLLAVVQHTQDRESRLKYAMLLQLALDSHYDNPAQYFRKLKCSYVLWQNLQPAEREAAQVFMLGKVLYCMWEGCGSVTTLNTFSLENGAEGKFPLFTETPEALRQLILRCTLGAWECDASGPMLERVGDKLYCHHKRMMNGSASCTIADTVETARQFWMNELRKAERVAIARRRYRDGVATIEDLPHLPYLKRPRLDEVLESLESFVG